MAILEAHNIAKRFGSTEVLNNISFSLEEGEVLAIIGSSGSGKTTLLRCLNFLEKPDFGRVIVRGETLIDCKGHIHWNESDIKQKRRHFGLVFQAFNLFPQYTAFENITLARELEAKKRADYKKKQESHNRRNTQRRLRFS